MDPFSALSIAAAVVQFVDFTSSLLKEYREIRQTGQPLTFEAFEQTANDILILSDSLKSSTKSRDFPSHAALAEQEQALQSIALDCSKIAQELLDALQSLKPKKIDRAAAEELAKSGKETYRCKWLNFRQALQTIWKADYIETLQARLSRHREALVLRVLTCLNAKADAYHGKQCETLDDLQAGHAHIVEVLAFNRGEARQLKRDLDDTMETIKRNHGEVLAAIVTMSDGQTRSIVPRHTARGQFSTNYEQSVLQIGRGRDGSGLGSLASLTPFNYDHLRRKLLDCLHFRQIRDRVDDVKDAHKSTFRWVFHKPDAVTQPWSDFPKWLQSHHGVYWINGKAGSGKSTLMKFILEDDRTWSHLSKWAGGADLVAASFFFWNLGTPLQKTQEGLLRSLLHDVLERHPGLIPVVMPELCRDLSMTPQQHSNSLGEPDLAQLKRWFRRLSRHANASCPLFFHIDGLDEYDGDPAELVDLINSSASRNVKFLVSSRPVTACTDAFAGVAGLRLDDLTRDDMLKYCNSILGKYLRHGESEETLLLINELVDKSSGVFLWLVLVTKSVLQGFQDGDNIRELRDRLEELPIDLVELYAHMMKRIPAKYRPQASELFQVYEKSRQVEQGIRGHPILAIQLSFISEEWDDVLSASCKQLTRKQENARVDDIDRRIRSRCYGFLEIQKRKPRRRVKSLAEHLLTTSRVVRPHVDFIHRTVVEFLRDGNVCAEIKSWTDADPYLGVFKTCIMMAKSFSPSNVVHTRANPVWESMYTGLRYAQLAEQNGRPFPATYLNAFDKIFCGHWEGAQEYYHDFGYESVTSKHWSRLFFHGRNSTVDYRHAYRDHLEDIREGDKSLRCLWSTDLESHQLIDATEHLGFSRVAIIHGLGSFLWVELMRRDAQALKDLLAFWLDLHQSSFPLRPKQPCTTSLSFYLLDAGVKVSDRVDGEDAFTIWRIFLTELCSSRDLANFSKEQAGELASLACQFLQIHLGDKPWTPDSERYRKLLSPHKPVFEAKRVPEFVGLFDILAQGITAQEARSRSISTVDIESENPRTNPVLSPPSSSSLSKRSVSTTTSTHATSIASTSEGVVSSPKNKAASGTVELKKGKARRVSQLLKNGKKKLELPLARWQGQWRQWQVYDSLHRVSGEENNH